jgi:hypothetical protein
MWRVCAVPTMLALARGYAQTVAQTGAPNGDPIPGVRQLMTEVAEHQKKLEKVREDYTYRAVRTDEEIDSDGHVKKTEVEERDVFFVNSHRIERTVKKDGKPLEGHALDKEQERVNKTVEKAQNTPPGKPLEGQESITITKLLDIMDETNPRRENFRGHTAIVFDFAGKHDAKTHGLAEDASKKLAGTLWVDEKDRQVLHMEAHFTDNFHVGGGLVANVQKGSSFVFDQLPVNGEVWFPTYAEGRVEARILLVKGMREHFVERDSDYVRFTVTTETSKTATVVPETKK